VNIYCPEPFNVPVCVAPPSIVNVTVPPGVPAAEATLAVTLSDCPYTIGLVTCSVVVVAIAFTFTAYVEDVDPEKLASPLYVHVKLCVPAARLVVVKYASPAASSEPLASVVVLPFTVSVSVYVPLGIVHTTCVGEAAL
jgi:hypothetical protein